MADVRELLLRDAQAVGDGIYPPIAGPPVEGFADHLARIREMFEDLPDTLRRRQSGIPTVQQDWPIQTACPTISSKIFTINAVGI